MEEKKVYLTMDRGSRIFMIGLNDPQEILTDAELKNLEVICLNDLLGHNLKILGE